MLTARRVPGSRTRARAARTCAAAGVACLMLLPLSAPAAATGRPVEIYDAGGHAQGVVATLAVRPSIFDPLVQAGLLYAQADLSSRGQGHAYALSSQAFPGRFAVGAIGCGGLPGSQWAQGHYPASGRCKQEEEFQPLGPVRSTAFSQQRCVRNDNQISPVHTCAGPWPHLDEAINGFASLVRPGVAYLHAKAANASSRGTAVSGRYTIGHPDEEPLIELHDGVLHADGRVDADGALVHEVRVVLHDVRLLGGLIRIDAIDSLARTRSDGTTAEAEATLTFVRARAAIAGRERRVEISASGVEVNDPALSREENLGLSEQLEEALLGAGVRVTAATPQRIVDGSAAEAAVGGLVLHVGGRLPRVKVPGELAPVYGEVVRQVPTTCLSEARDDLARTHEAFEAARSIPLCAGAGAVPLSNNHVPLTLTVAAAASFAVGTPGYEPPGSTTQGPSLGGGGAGNPTPGGPAVLGDGVPRGDDSGPAHPTARPQLYGLVARLPAAALAWSGALLLVLAVTLACGPSLRRAGADR